jgi:chemotaxis protein MotB
MKRGDKDHEIIVRRRSKKAHDDAHGGAWKVAFADFTLAMMALFMVLWIVQPQNQGETLAGDMAPNPMVDGGAGIFDGRSRSPLDLDGVPVQVNRRTAESNEATRPQSRSDDNATIPGEAAPMDLRELARMMEVLALQLDAEANIEVQVVPQGLRILIKDDQQRFMFERGSARLDPHFQQLLNRLAGVLAPIDNKLIISGHTDATAYRDNSHYNNWNLSGDRALRARNVMVDAGLPSGNILQVTAQADGMPLRPDTPEDGANRRIEILLLTAQAESLYRELFGDAQLRVDYSAEGINLVTPQETLL